MTLRDVAIVGLGETKFGKHSDRTITDLGVEACLKAIRDAGIAPRQIGLATGGCCINWRWGEGLYITQIVLRELGVVSIPMFRTECGCATGSAAFRDVWYRIATGEHDIGLAFGVERMTGADSGAILGATTDQVPEREGDIGLTAPGIYAMMARRMMTDFGITREQIAKVAVKNRRFGAQNPLSQFAQAVTLDEVLGARMISDPLTLYQCCGRGDGAAAVVLMDAETARQYTADPVIVAAQAFTSGSYRDDTSFTSFGSDVAAGQQAYAMAGIGPEDIDLAEVHDSFAPAELKHYQDLGFCPPGEAGRFIDEGRSDMGGDIVVNASGGLLSKGHVIAATGISQIGELVKQLRGQAGARQVEGARVALAHNSGGYVHTEFCAASVTVLRR